MLIMICLILVAIFGCTVPLAVTGISGASPVAFNYLGKGKSESSWLARYDDVVAATLQAGKTLSLVLEEQETGENTTTLHYADLVGDKMDVRVERRTDTLTWIHLDVGIFGLISMSRLMARQIKFEIAIAGAYLRDWSPEQGE